jgi:hypothetical protein
VFTLGVGTRTRFFANVYSDKNHTAVVHLFEHQLILPRLHAMCGDFNIRHVLWDSEGPEACVHADRLVAVAQSLGLALSGGGCTDSLPL